MHLTNLAFRNATRVHYNTTEDHYELVGMLTEPTCEEGGTARYSCTCGFTTEKNLEPSGHMIIGGMCEVCDKVFADRLMGDMNGNDVLDTADVKIIICHINGIAPVDGYIYTIGDINGDGVINTKDARGMLLELVK